MGRMIDADLLETLIKMEYCVIINGHLAIRDSDTGSFKPLLDQIKTAYDVDKVVATIKTKHCKKCRNIWKSNNGDKYCKDVKCEIEEVCEIVRNGGKE